MQSGYSFNTQGAQQQNLQQHQQQQHQQRPQPQQQAPQGRANLNNLRAQLMSTLKNQRNNK
jgi:Tfp pilus assembly protein PilO